MAVNDGLSRLVARARPRHRTTAEFVEATLREAILTGVIAPGTPLRQEELAETFGVSRMPVREALRQLEARALAEFHPHRGAVVAEISAADGADIGAIRMALEPMALRLSLPGLTAADLDQAEELIAEMDGEADPGRMGELNRRFHMTLYARAGRPRLLALTEQHLLAADRYLRFQFAALGYLPRSQDEHRALLAACRAGDAEEGCRLVTEHVGQAAEQLTAFLEGREAG
ncbi:GntR family transcriptional regulator [Azospirillum brasilense]|uniref:GntR family transcriptional regulator n=1 Tax=Azospirillum brasilense TaxID=192 RepID=UPI000E6A125B|nr:GntR family transcriptional regulator [Azospirillum brasilense]NUB27079.1 FCD domain-containing protein [Azospirillum brasilense]NUB34841.1 FCD domain-containing protein [Azospirillum brasilense]RIW07335.1 GntR family transcriptional regulator [Azospirillum brasilense]